jgi:tetratricopeptide (TPR) repeat protein
VNLRAFIAVLIGCAVAITFYLFGWRRPATPEISPKRVIVEAENMSSEVPTNLEMDTEHTIRDAIGLGIQKEITRLFKSVKYKEAYDLAIQTMADKNASPQLISWIRKQLSALTIAWGWQNLKNNRCQEAIDIFEKAKTLGDHDLAEKGQAICYLKLESFQNSKASFEKYLEGNPNDAEMNLLYADLLESLGMYDQATEILAKVSSQKTLADQVDRSSVEKRATSMQNRATESALQATATSEHITLTYRAGEHEHLVNFVLQTFEEAILEYADIGFRIPERSIEVVLYPDDKFQDLVTYSPKWAGGLFDGRIRIPVGSPSSNGQLSKVIRHELTHALLHQMAGNTGLLPAWFNEGLAQYLECRGGCRSPRFQFQYGFQPSDVFEKQFSEMEPRQAKMAYNQSLYLVHLLTLSGQFDDAKLPVVVRNISPQLAGGSDALLAPADWNYSHLYGVAKERWEKKRSRSN